MYVNWTYLSVQICIHILGRYKNVHNTPFLLNTIDRGLFYCLGNRFECTWKGNFDEKACIWAKIPFRALSPNMRRRHNQVSNILVPVIEMRLSIQLSSFVFYIGQRNLAFQSPWTSVCVLRHRTPLLRRKMLKTTWRCWVMKSQKTSRIYRIQDTGFRIQQFRAAKNKYGKLTEQTKKGKIWRKSGRKNWKEKELIARQSVKCLRASDDGDSRAGGGFSAGVVGKKPNGRSLVKRFVCA